MHACGSHNPNDHHSYLSTVEPSLRGTPMKVAFGRPYFSNDSVRAFQLALYFSIVLFQGFFATFAPRAVWFSHAAPRFALLSLLLLPRARKTSRSTGDGTPLTVTASVFFYI